MKAALHFQNIPSWAKALIPERKTDWNIVIDPPSVDPFPGCKTIGRTYLDDSESNILVMMGANGADVWFQKFLEYYNTRPYIHVWMGPNEPYVRSLDERKALNAFTIRLAQRMHSIGKLYGGLSLSVGWPNVNEAKDLAECVPYCDYIFFHEYAYPTMQSDSTWKCLRYRRTWAELQALGIAQRPTVITECGLDDGQRHGWKTFAKTEDEFINQLQWYDSEVQKDPYLLAYCLFTAGPIGWGDFEITETIARRVLASNTNTIPQPPPEAEDEDTDMSEVKVYDINGNEQDWNWMVSRYGNVKHLESPSYPKFALKEVRCTIGPAIIKVEVQDTDGKPKVNQPVGNYWPNQELGGYVKTISASQVKQTFGKPSACIQNTDSNGLTGYGIYVDSYIKDKVEGGPHTLWVLSPSVSSDGISGVGMLGGTEHEGPLNPVFKLVNSAPINDPDTDNDTNNNGPDVSVLAPPFSMIQPIRNRAWNSAGIAYNPDGALYKFAKAHNLGRPVTNETDIDGWRIQGYEKLIVCVRIGEWNTVYAVSWL